MSMSKKQDRQAPRTATQIERKHQKVLSGQDEVMAKMNAQIENLAKKLENSDDDTDVAVLQLKVNALEQNVESLLALDVIVSGLVDKVYALEELVATLTDRLTTAETTITSLVERVTTLEGNGEL